LPPLLYKKKLNANYTPNDNYTVTVIKGDFEIKLAKDPGVDLKIKGGSWPYDGKAHKVSPCTRRILIIRLLFPREILKSGRQKVTF
jgi:hypothetical protein